MHAPRFSLALVAFAIALFGPVSAHAAVPEAIVGGATRYDTAVLVSKRVFPSGAPAVVIASGVAWPDALGGSALAGELGAPVLLSPAESLPATVAAEIERLAPTRAYLLGGPASLSDTAAAQVAAALPPGSTITRLGGPSRYDVARLVAGAAVAERGSAPEVAFVVAGTGFADALSCSAPAYARGWPILLADPARPALVASQAAEIGATRAVIVGGPASVSYAVSGALTRQLGAANVERISAGDRFGVSVAVARFAEADAGLSLADPVFASGATPADGLAGSSLAASRGSVLLLADSRGLPEPPAAELYARRAEIDSFAFLGGYRSMPPWVRTDAQQALRCPPFSVARAMEHIRALAGLGPRGAGGSAEKAGADYMAARLRDYGYTVSVRSVALPGGKTSRNVIAELPGSAPGVIVLGGHLDSKPPSPGANDNASGVAVALELARVLAAAEGLVPTVRFIGFGAEEIGGPTPDDHHFGSRQYVASLSSAERAKIQSAVSIDMVGYGTVFNIRNLRTVAPMTTVYSLQAWGKGAGEPLPYLKDFGRSGWSDHEAFEFAGIPAAWLEWREDPVYHTARDTASHVQPDRVARTGRLVRGWLLGMDAAELDALR